MYSSRILFFLALWALCLFPQNTAIATTEHKVHQVRSGDTLWSISKQHGVPVKKIASANHIANPGKLEVGQQIVIPIAVPKNLSIQSIKYDTESMQELLKTYPKRKTKWKYIVIHHSATAIGDARSFDRFHRAKRHMPNGLAYHFVIGNGKGALDGEIEVGHRWEHQLAGGHTSIKKMNDVGIGICLVGNFQKTGPTNKQMKALVTLVQHLQKEYNIPTKRVLLHKDVKRGHTECPGRKFPSKSFYHKL